MTGKRNALDVPVERPFRLYVNEREIVTLMATPELLEELAAGWLWSNDLVSERADIKRMMVEVDRSIIWTEVTAELPETFNRTVSSGCGGGALIADLTAQLPLVAGTLTIKFNVLGALMDELFNLSTLYKRTGGVHGAAIATTEGIEFMAEDIGRHNAVDKVIGWALLNGVDLTNKLILTTGRISAEMMVKSAKVGFLVVASRTAATDLAVKLASEAGITLAGYVRTDAAVVYAGPERLEN